MVSLGINLFKFHRANLKVYLQDGDSVKGEGVDAMEKPCKVLRN